MFILTFRLPGKRLAAGVLTAAVLCGAAITGGTLTRQQDVQAAAAVDTASVSTNEDRIRYLASYGWTVEETATSCEDILIPQEFDETYTDYLQLQASQGFDLTQYAGKCVKRYTYTVTNYPTGEKSIQAGLLIYKNHVIGGEILSTSIDGFIHALSYPGSTA